MRKYPNIGELLKKKAEHRRSLAALSFEKKIEMVFKLRERRKFIVSNTLTPKSKSAKCQRLNTAD